MTFQVYEEVAAALAAGHAVVALESTVFSPFGLPAPANAEALAGTLDAVRRSGAVPALTAVLDGVARVGVDEAEHERILRGGIKVAARDLHVAIARGEAVGVTTVSASLALCARAGVSVFATGGIGGVHRDAATSGDVSADLGALAAYPVVTVCAGAKAFLDIARTLEHLDTLSVPVLGWRTDEFPMFWCRSSGLPVPHRVDDAARVAAIVRAQRELASTGGALVAVPVPGDAALERADVDAAIGSAANTGEVGPGVTPSVLAEIARLTEGRTVRANVALLEHNAAVAAEIAAAIATA